MTLRPPEPWRLLIDPPRPGAENMAIDDAMLEAISSGEAPPTLRLYAWSPPCLSLGLAQATNEVDLERLRGAGWGLVRRPTGGRALLHIDELTYAVAGPAAHPLLAGGVLPSYRALARALTAGLGRLGLAVELQPALPTAPAGSPVNPICFEVPSSYEIVAQGRKLVGSAQLRRQSGVLQHGAVPLAGDIARVCRVLAYPDEPARQAAAARLRARAATTESLLGRPVSWEEAADALEQGFVETYGIAFEPAGLTPGEIQRAAELVESRYDAEAWTARL